VTTETQAAWQLFSALDERRRDEFLDRMLAYEDMREALAVPIDIDMARARHDEPRRPLEDRRAGLGL